jgi:hypothetical protein
MGPRGAGVGSNGCDMVGPDAQLRSKIDRFGQYDLRKLVPTRLPHRGQMTGSKLYSFPRRGCYEGQGRVNMDRAAHGVWAFLGMYIVRRDLADGWAGFIIALWNFEDTFDRCAKRCERAQGHGLPSEDTAPLADKM